ncbi:MAG: YciI family protein [Saprospiraceae bacterium]
MKKEAILSIPKPLISASVPGILTAILLAVSLTAVGYFAGKSQTASTALPASEKPQFALLVKADDVAPADPSQQFREYSAWANNLKKERWSDGEALHGKAWRLHETNGNIEIIEHTLKTSADELSGYFLYEATDAEEALKIARTCPHLKYSGTLELREIYR